MTDDASLPVASPTWNWQSEAACRGLGDDLFYARAEERGKYKRLREQAAKAICATCAVSDLCLTSALAAGEPYGVWGGLTTDERVALGGNGHARRLGGR